MRRPLNRYGDEFGPEGKELQTAASRPKIMELIAITTGAD
jgi:hypothetical protein